MILIEKHIINKNDSNWKQIDHLCFLSKNLYNQALFKVKESLSNSGKFLRYNDLEKILKKEVEEYNNYNMLTSSVSQQVLMIFDRNFKSYFSLIKKWKKDKTKFQGCPKMPSYKHKEKGRNIVIFRQQGVLRLKEGYIYFPRKNNLNPIKTLIKDINQIKQIRLVPQFGCYKIEVVYERKEKELKKDNNNYLSIDLGLNNLATCFDNKNLKSFIINGKPLKSINQYYNKQKVVLQSNLKKNHNKYNSRRINRLTLKRNNKISDYLHKSSRIIVDYCLKNEINSIVVGYNKEWKQNINLGKQNNQNFVNIPFLSFINMLEYKSTLEGINFRTNEESYTSKCSSIDLEAIQKHEEYMGKRIKRGLFVSKEGIIINADVNGAINILRKATNKTFDMKDTISRGYVTYPSKVSPL